MLLLLLKKKKKKEIGADFPCHMYKIHSGGPALTNLSDKAHAHCFILSFQWHEMGVKHGVWSCHGSLGSIQPERSCSKWAGRETQAGLACSAHSFRRSADISWKLLTQIIVLSFWCFIICFLHCSSWLWFIFDQGHVSVSMRSNESAFCSFSGFPNIYNSVPFSAMSWRAQQTCVPHITEYSQDLFYQVTLIGTLDDSRVLSHGVSLWQGPGVIISVLYHTGSLATNQDIPGKSTLRKEVYRRSTWGLTSRPTLSPPSDRKVLMISACGLETSLEATC